MYGDKKKFNSEIALWREQVADDPAITPFDFRVAFTLSRHFNFKKNGEAWPCQQRIAMMTHSTRRGVQKSINRLKERRHLEVISGCGRRRPNRYRSRIHQWYRKARMANDGSHFLNGEGWERMINQEIANDETANSEWQFSLNSKENSYKNSMDANYPAGRLNAAAPPSAKPPPVLLEDLWDQPSEGTYEEDYGPLADDECPF